MSNFNKWKCNRRKRMKCQCPYEKFSNLPGNYYYRLRLMSFKFSGCIHYTVSSILGLSCSTQLQTSRCWLLCPECPVCSVCSSQARAQHRDTPSGSHQYQVLLLIAIIATQWLSPVCRRAIEARHCEVRLRSFLLLLFSWNRWIIDWKIWSSGRLCLVTAALRQWRHGGDCDRD